VLPGFVLKIRLLRTTDWGSELSLSNNLGVCSHERRDSGGIQSRTVQPTVFRTWDGMDVGEPRWLFLLRLSGSISFPGTCPPVPGTTRVGGSVGCSSKPITPSNPKQGKPFLCHRHCLIEHPYGSRLPACEAQLPLQLGIGVSKSVLCCFHALAAGVVVSYRPDCRPMPPLSTCPCTFFSQPLNSNTVPDISPAGLLPKSSRHPRFTVAKQHAAFTRPGTLISCSTLSTPSARIAAILPSTAT